MRTWESTRKLTRFRNKFHREGAIHLTYMCTFSSTYREQEVCATPNLFLLALVVVGFTACYSEQIHCLWSSETVGLWGLVPRNSSQYSEPPKR